MPTRSPVLAVAVAAALLAGCGGGGSATPTVEVFRPLGSLQCVGGGSSIDSLRQQLLDAGIEVSGAACGTDGRVYPDRCGAPDGRIGVFEVPVTQVEAATQLLFAPMASLDSARVLPCD